ncbi:MAG: phosphoribosylglycinamide formyltransferase [Nannocystaceae bacterium]
MTPPPRLGVLASGGGSNTLALIEAHRRGDLAAPIVLVVSNNSRAGALKHAREHGISAEHISGRSHADVSHAILAALHKHAVDIVVLAGYMKLLGHTVLASFPGRVLNIHPGPLPRFGGPGMFGSHVHEAVLRSSTTHSGPTVHLVDARYDEGPVIAHRRVPVRSDDTSDSLAARVRAAEHDLYWKVIQDQFCGTR